MLEPSMCSKTIRINHESELWEKKSRPEDHRLTSQQTVIARGYLFSFPTSILFLRHRKILYFL